MQILDLTTDILGENNLLGKVENSFDGKHIGSGNENFPLYKFLMEVDKFFLIDNKNTDITFITKDNFYLLLINKNNKMVAFFDNEENLELKFDCNIIVKKVNQQPDCNHDEKYLLVIRDGELKGIYNINQKDINTTEALMITDNVVKDVEHQDMFDTIEKQIKELSSTIKNYNDNIPKENNINHAGIIRNSEGINKSAVYIVYTNIDEAIELLDLQKEKLLKLKGNK